MWWVFIILIISLFLKIWEIWIINLKLIKFSCILGKYNTTTEIRRRWFTLKKYILISDLYDCLGLLNSTISDHYDTNLNELLPYLSYEIPSSSFAIGTKGQGADTVYGLAICCGDILEKDCKSVLLMQPTKFNHIVPIIKVQ